ncbi:MAG TPA: hypothetical protein ENJ60_04275 [Aeromonadales bacterium]|nr:hypothetical protein [Aeromonadales bacterium]
MAKRQVELVLAAQNKTDKAFNQVNQNISNLEGYARNIKAIGSIFTGLTAGATAGIWAMNSMSESLVEVLGKLDDIGKASRRLGLTTDELQGLREVAKASGVEVSAFDTAFQRFARRVGQAKLGTGELVKAFEKLDIKFTDSRGNLKSNADLFAEYGRKIAAVKDENVQLALTMAGVDTEGVKLIEMFRTSATEQQKIIDKAKKLGDIYGKDMIKSAEAYLTQLNLIRDAQDRLNNRSEVGMSSMILEWEKLKLKVIETKNEFLKYIGWQGVAHDDTTKNLIESNKLYKQQIDDFKEKLKIETDPTRAAYLKQNLEYAEKAQKATEKEIKDKILYYEKLSNLESNNDTTGGAEVNTELTKLREEAEKPVSNTGMIPSIEKQSEAAKQKISELKKTIADMESQIGRRTGSDEDLQTVDLARKMQDAYRNVSSKNPEDLKQAIRDAQEAVRVAEALRKSDKASQFYLDNMTKQAAEIVKKASGTESATMEQTVKQNIEVSDGSVSGTSRINITPEINKELMLSDAAAAQKELQSFYDRNPVTVRFDISGAGSDDIVRQALKEGRKT